ncbi:MAG: PaaX family transcriptional regulator C-terminal domain-containing protein, partial [Anaerolineales bacterium]
MIIKNMDSLERQPVRTQFLVFTLFGDYILPRGGEIWTGDLLYLLALLGVSERATRSALSRMTRKGWLAANKQGRRSRYSLTARGSTLLESGHRRIFEPVFTDWDGKWQLVVYSLPEEKRSKRHTLRTQLTWLGFGSLTPGAWISPHDRSTELERLFTDLEVGHLVDMFSGPYLGPSSGQKLVTRCWELDGLETKYHDFITRYQPAYIQCRSQNSGALEPEDCFVRRFWLMHEFQAFTLKDPNLPIALLPLNWAGFAAREL